MNLALTAKKIGHVIIFQAKKHAPEILLGVGTAGILGTIFLASKETLKAQEVLEKHLEDRNAIKEASGLEDYTKEDEKKDKVQLYISTGKKLAKVYWPAVTLGAASFACIFASYGIMKGRNAAILAAYNAANKAYESYRERVRTEIGDEKEADIYADRRDEKIESTKTNAEGKEVKTKEKIKVFTDKYGHSLYSFFFDMPTCPNLYRDDPQLNKQTILQIQSDLNDKLGARGWLSIMDVYEAFQMEIDPSDPRFKELQLLGWRTQKYGGKGYIDFGLFDGYRQEKIDFVNGRERSVLLDMNIDGYIFDNYRAEMRAK